LGQASVRDEKKGDVDFLLFRLPFGRGRREEKKKKKGRESDELEMV